MGVIARTFGRVAVLGLKSTMVVGGVVVGSLVGSVLVPTSIAVVAVGAVAGGVITGDSLFNGKNK